MTINSYCPPLNKDYGKWNRYALWVNLIHIHDESHLYITKEQAQALADALLKAVEKSGKSSS
jgi:hypothetical protein